MFREKLKESSRVVESIFGGKLLDLRPLKLLSVDRHRKIKPQFYVREGYYPYSPEFITHYSEPIEFEGERGDRNSKKIKTACRP